MFWCVASCKIIRGVDSGFHDVDFDSSYWIQDPNSVDSGFQRVGFWIPHAEVSRIPESTSKCFLDSRISLPYMGKSLGVAQPAWAFVNMVSETR